VRVVLRSWAGKLSGPWDDWGDVALTDEAGDLRVFEVEGVPSIAVCLLLMASNLFSSPLSRATGTNGMSCSLVVVPGPKPRCSVSLHDSVEAG